MWVQILQNNAFFFVHTVDKYVPALNYIRIYTEDLQSYNELSIQASYGSAMCCITLAQSKGKTNLYEEAKAGINFLESMLPDSESVKELKNTYYTSVRESGIKARKPEE